jgi:hypothetical protein
MRMLKLALSGAVLVLLVYVGAAHAQATRTWVSGVGDDANPCSRTAPCKTWAGAISKTADGGEISALDPGGFGAVTITKGITLNGDGTLASVLAALTNGIIVNAPSNRDVIIRNLSINGVGNSASPGLNGIRFLGGGSLTLQNVNIYGFSQSCLDIAITSGGPITHIVDSNFANCATGIRVSDTSGQRASVNVTRSTITDSTTGINGAQAANIALTDVTISGATTAVLLTNAAGPASEVNMNRCLITESALGLQVAVGTSARLSDNYFAANGKAMDNQGACQSTANNRAGGNVNPNTGAACTALAVF